jgi:hypothetical protein
MPSINTQTRISLTFFGWRAFVGVSSAIHWWIDDGKRLKEDSVIVRFL